VPLQWFADHTSFRAQELISSGVVEGLNNNAKVTMRESYGFGTYRVLELAFDHSIGKLLERNQPTISSDESKLKASAGSKAKSSRSQTRPWKWTLRGFLVRTVLAV
jgi:hypothetical protein